MVEVFSGANPADIPNLVANNYTDHQGPGETEIRGLKGFMRVVSAVRGAMADLRVEVMDLIGEGDRVTARLRWEGRDADGKEIRRETIDIIRVENGRAVEHWGVKLWSHAPNSP